MMTREGGAQPKEYLAKYTADRVRTVGMAWLGSTFDCCECHDHKFDPIKTKDFYSLGAFFADLKQWGVYQDYDYTPNPDLPGWSNDHPWPPEIFVESPALQRRDQKLKEEAASIAKDAVDNEAQAASWQTRVASICQESHRLGNSPGCLRQNRACRPRRPPAKNASANANAKASQPLQGAEVDKNRRILFGPEKGGVR